MKGRFYKKTVAISSAFFLLVYSFLPYVLVPVNSQDQTQTEEQIVSNPESTQEETTPATDPAPEITQEAQTSPEITGESGQTLPAENNDSPEDSTSTSSEPRAPPQEGDILDGIWTQNAENIEQANSTSTPIPEPIPTPIPEVFFTVWLSNKDGSYTTIGSVELNISYVSPFNDNLIIKFTKLPLNSSQVTIREIAASFDLGQDKQIGSVYEITSDMPDGSFSYNLTLPVPADAERQNLEVRYAETLNEITQAEELTQAKEFSTEAVTVKDLDHFTVFVLVNDVDTDNPDNLGDSDDVANGAFSVIDDTWVDQDNPTTTKGTDDELKVRSKSGSDNRRAFVNFDVSSVASGSEVTKATLRLFLKDAPGASRTYQAYRITDDWTEDSLDWDPQPGNAGVTDDVASGTTANVWLEWDVTSDVQAFVNGDLTNYGWMVRDSAEDSSTSREGKFRSSEDGDELKRPQLVIDFAAPDDQPTKYNSPTDSVGTIGGDNDGFESNPINALTDGGGVASNINGAGDRHIFRDYYFEIPTDAVINGIEARTDWYLDSDGGTNSLDVELSWDGGASWTTTKSDVTETDKEHIASLGGANDTWGREWLAGEFANENFKVRVTTSSTNSGRDFFLDWIPVRVYYTEEEDTTPPVSEFTSPAEGSFWNSPIEISGSSTDIPDTTVNYIKLYYRTSGEEENPWIEIPDSQQDNTDDEPFNWSFNWTPSEEGTFDIKAEATDTAGNTELSPVVEYVTYDVTDPTSDIDYPIDEETYTQDTWNEEIQGTATDEPSSGVSKVYVSIQADDGDYWCDENECGEAFGWYSEDEGETLNEADFDSESGEWSYEFDFISEEGTQGYTARSHAEDNAGNLEETNTVHFYFSTDTTAPTSTIDSPEEGLITNDPIEISGSSSDESLDTVDYVQLFYRESVGEEEEENSWNEIDTNSEEEGTQPLSNTELVNPFEWSFTWTPDSDGKFDIKAEATDTAGNTESSPIVNDVIYDTTAPATPEATPGAGDYLSDQSVTLASSDDLSGVDNIFYTTDGTDPSDTNGTEYVDPIVVGVDTTLRAIAYDNAGNTSDILEAVYGIAPVISSETSSLVTSSTATITWTTDDLSTSRVIYDTVSHPVLGSAPNYDYANSTVEADTSPMVTSHSVAISGLTAGTTYYYRTVSHGSPDAVSDEHSLVTTAASTTGTVAGTSTGGNATPTCSDTKPASAPTLLSAIAGLNSVLLTWTKAANPVSYYLVAYGNAPGTLQFGNPNVGGSDTTSYSVVGLSGGATYYFKVRGGNGCAPGDFSNELAVTPSGGFVAGPAEGFAQGVLGVETEEAKVKQEGKPETLGKYTLPTAKGLFANANFIPAGLAIFLFMLLFFLSRRRED